MDVAHGHYARILRVLSQIGAVSAAAIGLTVLVGWLFHIDSLKSLNPAWVTMKPNTAVGFVLAGGGLWLAGGDSGATPGGLRRWGILVAGGLLTLLAAVTWFEYLGQLDLGVDELLFREDAQAVNTAAPGRMALRTVLLFLVSGTALAGPQLWRRGAWRWWLQQALGGAVVLCALAGMLMYLFGARPATGLVSYTPIAYHTAVGFVLVGMGLIAAHPEDGPARVFAHAGIAGMLARRVVPLGILIPTAVGYLRYLGELAGWYESTTGLVYATMVYIALLTVVLIGFAYTVARLERQRRAAEESRDRYFMQAQDMLCVAGFDGYFKQVNPAFERILGYSAEEILSKPWLHFVHPEDRASTEAEAAKYSESTPTLSFRNRYICKDGQVKTLAWTATPVPATQTIYGAARDVTEELRAQSQIASLNAELATRLAALELAHRELEAFSYSVSHDLRAPLRHIDGYVEMLDEHLVEKAPGALDGDGRRLMDSITRASKNMARLIDELLEFSRMGRRDMTEQKCDLGALVAEQSAKFTAEAGGRTIHWTVAPLPAVTGDPTMLTQVWQNLLSNAVKYSRTKPEAAVTVSWQRQDTEAVFCVADNGVGFDDRYKHKLFGVFERLHSGREFEGTGIGLAIVRRVIERHGGRTWAEGELGAGAKFFFSLPAARVQATESRKAAAV